MKSSLPLIGCLLFLSSTLVKVAHAADENFGERFLGSPLLVLVAVMIIAALASLYHRIRK